MTFASLTNLPIDGSQALLFTDARGRVVFVDNNFLKLMSRAHAKGIVGAPLHTIIGVEPDVATQLLHETSRAGTVSDRVLDLRAETGALVRVTCSSTATYDEQRAFIGADMTLVEVARAQAPELAAAQDSIDADSEAADARAFLTVYFLSVLQALRDLVTRTGGEGLRARVDAVINDTAKRNDWPVLIQAGKVYAEVHKREGEIFRGLLARAIAYSIDMIGQSQVIRVLARVDEQTDPTTLELADQLGLRELITIHS